MSTAQAAAPSPPVHDPYQAWKTPGFSRYLTGNFIASIARQMVTMCVGWEIYQRTHSTALLGLIGLATALPLFLCTLPAGYVADHFSRKNVIIYMHLVLALCSLGLAALSHWHTQLPAWEVLELPRHGLEWIVAMFEKSDTPITVDRGVVGMMALVFTAGVANTFVWASRASFLPLLVSQEVLPNAISWNSSFLKTASAGGPAMAGILIATMGYPLIYSIHVVSALIFIGLLMSLKVNQPPPVTASTADPAQRPSRTRELLSGIRFVFGNRLMLAAMSLDLFAVLLGSIMALLPMFAERLGVGSVGAGWMIAVESIGAILTSLAISHLPPMQNVGRTILWAVAAFGGAIIGFGLAPWYWLALIMLFLTGVFDSFSAIIRNTLVQLSTPEGLRGRVTAVNNIFIGSSNELGAFRSGMSAATFGPVAAVVGGGVGTILVVCAVALWAPELRRFKSFKKP